MELRCVSKSPTAEQRLRLGSFLGSRDREFPVELAVKYRCYSVRVWGCGLWVVIEGFPSQLVSVPLCLFEIVDSRLPPFWETWSDADGDLEIGSPTLQDRGFFDDLSEGISEALAALERLREEHVRWEALRDVRIVSTD